MAYAAVSMVTVEQHRITVAQAAKASVVVLHPLQPRHPQRLGELGKRPSTPFILVSSLNYYGCRIPFPIPPAAKRVGISFVVPHFTSSDESDFAVRH